MGEDCVPLTIALCVMNVIAIALCLIRPSIIQPSSASAFFEKQLAKVKKRREENERKSLEGSRMQDRFDGKKSIETSRSYERVSGTAEVHRSVERFEEVKEGSRPPDRFEDKATKLAIVSPTIAVPTKEKAAQMSKSAIFAEESQDRMFPQEVLTISTDYDLRKGKADKEVRFKDTTVPDGKTEREVRFKDTTAPPGKKGADDGGEETSVELVILNKLLRGKMDELMKYHFEENTNPWMRETREIIYDKHIIKSAVPQTKSDIIETSIKMRNEGVPPYENKPPRHTIDNLDQRIEFKDNSELRNDLIKISSQKSRLNEEFEYRSEKDISLKSQEVVDSKEIVDASNEFADNIVERPESKQGEEPVEDISKSLSSDVLESEIRKSKHVHFLPKPQIQKGPSNVQSESLIEETSLPRDLKIVETNFVDSDGSTESSEPQQKDNTEKSDKGNLLPGQSKVGVIKDHQEFETGILRKLLEKELQHLLLHKRQFCKDDTEKSFIDQHIFPSGLPSLNSLIDKQMHNVILNEARISTKLLAENFSNIKEFDPKKNFMSNILYDINRDISSLAKKMVLFTPKNKLTNFSNENEVSTKGKNNFDLLGDNDKSNQDRNSRNARSHIPGCNEEPELSTETSPEKSKPYLLLHSELAAERRNKRKELVSPLKRKDLTLNNTTDIKTSRKFDSDYKVLDKSKDTDRLEKKQRKPKLFKECYSQENESNSNNNDYIKKNTEINISLTTSKPTENSVDPKDQHFKQEESKCFFPKEKAQFINKSPIKISRKLKKSMKQSILFDYREDESDPKNKSENSSSQSSGYNCHEEEIVIGSITLDEDFFYGDNQNLNNNIVNTTFLDVSKDDGNVNYKKAESQEYIKMLYTIEKEQHIVTKNVDFSGTQDDGQSKHDPTEQAVEGFSKERSNAVVCSNAKQSTHSSDGDDKAFYGDPPSEEFFSDQCTNELQEFEDEIELSINSVVSINFKEILDIRRGENIERNIVSPKENIIQTNNFKLGDNQYIPLISSRIKTNMKDSLLNQDKNENDKYDISKPLISGRSNEAKLNADMQNQNNIQFKSKINCDFTSDTGKSLGDKRNLINRDQNTENPPRASSPEEFDIFLPLKKIIAPSGQQITDIRSRRKIIFEPNETRKTENDNNVTGNENNVPNLTTSIEVSRSQTTTLPQDETSNKKNIFSYSNLERVQVNSEDSYYRNFDTSQLNEGKGLAKHKIIPTESYQSSGGSSLFRGNSEYRKLPNIKELYFKLDSVSSIKSTETVDKINSEGTLIFEYGTALHFIAYTNIVEALAASISRLNLNFMNYIIKSLLINYSTGSLSEDEGRGKRNRLSWTRRSFWKRKKERKDSDEDTISGSSQPFPPRKKWFEKSKRKS